MRIFIFICTFSIFQICLFAQSYQFLGEYTGNGTPLYLDGRDEISSNTLQQIENAFPEGLPVPTYNPQYITAGYDSNLELTENADVWVTFVAEGAGYRNVLGFYTYDVSTPLTSTPTPEDITIIFPNCSGLNSGGSLVSGDKVKIGRFKAGTGIGWVLLANAWNGQEVTSGFWQVFSDHQFNPESDEDKQHHTVMIHDPDNELIILGIEDIRRDYQGCDNDFNDALFYITANPYEAMKVTNIKKIEVSARVSSSNDGGLESNGDLAKLIAKRNFGRVKNHNFHNTKKLQTSFKRQTGFGEVHPLSHYLPDTGVLGIETASLASPNDLINITNATNIFSLDYYEGSNRVASSLITTTKDNVYNHSKNTCDRLNNAQLIDARVIKVDGYEMVYTELEHYDKSSEFSVSFSVRDNGNSQSLYSLWNIEDYPKGNYRNFQIWGNTTAQVGHIIHTILQNLKNEKELIDNNDVPIGLPDVFIKKGKYSNGILSLDIINRKKATNLYLEGSYKTTEIGAYEPLIEYIALDGAWEQRLDITLDPIFDMGFSISPPDSGTHDSMYVADGPWGIDYNNNVDQVTDFTINAQNQASSYEGHAIERNITAKGSVKETVNIFRNILAGNLSLDIKNYQYLQLDVNTNLPIEVSLLTDTTTSWEDRLSFDLNAETETKHHTLALSEFKNTNGEHKPFSALQSIVFSVQGDYNQYTNFDLSTKDLVLTTSPKLVQNKESIITKVFTPSTDTDNHIKCLPNPASNKTKIILPKISKNVSWYLYDQKGNLSLYEEDLKINGQKFTIELSTLDVGLYFLTIIDKSNETSYACKVLKQL